MTALRYWLDDLVVLRLSAEVRREVGLTALVLSERVVADLADRGQDLVFQPTPDCQDLLEF